MQSSYETLKTQRKPKKVGNIARARSHDQLNLQQLSPRETKLLLALPKDPTDRDLQRIIEKQQLLADKKLFDPFQYFGCPNFMTIEESYRYHSPRLEAMFAPPGGKTQRKIVKKTAVEEGVSKLEASPSMRQKVSLISGQKSRRTVTRSPKSFVKENKQNFLRLNLSKVQQVRVKLKLGKK